MAVPVQARTSIRMINASLFMNHGPPRWFTLTALLLRKPDGAQLSFSRRRSSPVGEILRSRLKLRASRGGLWGGGHGRVLFATGLLSRRLYVRDIAENLDTTLELLRNQNPVLFVDSYAGGQDELSRQSPMHTEEAGQPSFAIEYLHPVHGSILNPIVTIAPDARDLRASEAARAVIDSAKHSDEGDIAADNREADV